MNYANGRPAKLNDLVFATGLSGPYIGRLVSIEGAHLKIMPIASQSAFYHEPATVYLASDAILPAAEIKPVV